MQACPTPAARLARQCANILLCHARVSQRRNTPMLASSPLSRAKILVVIEIQSVSDRQKIGARIRSRLSTSNNSVLQWKQRSEPLTA